ncbi:copper-binding protein [Asticcacaulis sp. EMRT-3]|uniref:copper-binding protein n=1 Tax=Asticcacaulis sp. EMRT-3 TaxID=3040349 RepID=UPI0024AFFBAF|nr:copper-binding protein [Asticcacaulis sp. EMRT-3]MDI7776542.1 copper-binding protein [Asticcacaulis sp. EMRT-3]
MRAKLIPLPILVLVGLLAACSPKPPATETAAASSATPAEMSGMSDLANMSATALDSDTGAKLGSGVGVITAIDKGAGKVTIKHEAIPAVDWPAMTMTFKAAPTTLLDGLTVGEKIKFDVKVLNSDVEVTAVTPQ